ncbi:MAG: hypothetical protein M1837_002957 [Sclerophora amabilis]|nr:MAG: hypothetical protein M1837_002957 [Sclerophora amabilis]
MSPLRRRSARLKGGNNASPMKQTHAVAELSSLVERDESPGLGVHSSLNAIVSSPIAPPNSTINGRASQFQKSGTQTPSAGGPLYPSLEERHPSKVQHSTTKEPDSGLRLGFFDAGSMTAPAKSGQAIGIAQDTPTKATGFLSKIPSSPSFNFRPRNPDPGLSPDAQRMMGEVRDVAANLKAKMINQRGQEKPDASGASGDLFGVGGRKLATPKGKAGRFSDVHMEEFKKMDSIAGHPSAYRAQTGRSEATTKCLKRSKSQAKLDDPDCPAPNSSSSHSPEKKAQGARLQKPSPTKRMKSDVKDDTSAARPISRDGKDLDKKLSTPSLWRSKSGMVSSITTPTKASLARSASVKTPRTSLVPVARTPASHRFTRGVRTEGNKKYLSSLAKFGNVKSILRRPQNGALVEGSQEKGSPHDTSATPVTHNQSNIDKELPLLPETPKSAPKSGIYRFPSMKKVTFTPTATETGAAQASPSPAKASAQQRSSSKPDSSEVTYPALPETSKGSPPRSQAATPGDFTFRAEKSINFGPSTNGATIRQVRPSIGPGSAPGPATCLPAVAHGMSNKKRHRDTSDSGDENKEPQVKKQKAPVQSPPSAKAQTPKPRSRLTSPMKRGRKTGDKSPGLLSMSRLNALARPKGK